MGIFVESLGIRALQVWALGKEFERFLISLPFPKVFISSTSSAFWCCSDLLCCAFSSFSRRRRRAACLLLSHLGATTFTTGVQLPLIQTYFSSFLQVLLRCQSISYLFNILALLPGLASHLIATCLRLSRAEFRYLRLHLPAIPSTRTYIYY